MESPYDRVFEPAPEEIPDFQFPPEEVQFEEEISDESYGLIYRGYLTDDFSIGTHDIVIRTLKIGEELEAALVAAKYRDTIDYGRALATALVAAAIVTVDGQPLIQEGLGPNENMLESKFRYILRNWYWASTIKQIHDRYQSMYEKVQVTYEDLKKD
jgi:hypothetical protein